MVIVALIDDPIADEIVVETDVAVAVAIVEDVLHRLPALVMPDE